jgi:hypothetical protein
VRVGHALLRLEGDPGSNPACGRIFCLDNKKFLYTCEKDKYYDDNKHLFEQMY